MKFDISYPFKRKDIVEAGTGFRPNAVVKSINNSLDVFLSKELAKYGLNTSSGKTLSKSTGMSPSSDMKN